MPTLRLALATLLLCGACQSCWANAQVAQDGDEWYPQHTSQQQAPQQPEELHQQTPARKLAQQSSSPESTLTWHQGAAVTFSAVSEHNCCMECPFLGSSCLSKTGSLILSHQLKRTMHLQAFWWYAH